MASTAPRRPKQTPIVNGTTAPMFLDEFEFVKRLGEGAFATVWAARRKDPGGANHGKLYAVKHLKQRDDGADAAGLLGTPEFRSLKSIARHPHVLRAVQVARERGQVFLVTEWCDDDLLSIVEKARERGFGRVPDDVTRAAISHLIQALAHCHDSRWIHRDVKPENILVREGVAKLADFGEACEFDSEEKLVTYRGTRWYRAPEQFIFENAEPSEYENVSRRWHTGAADVWAAGCVMAELYLGHALFRGNSGPDMLRKMADTLGENGGVDETSELIRRWPTAANDDRCVPRGGDRLVDALNGSGIGEDALDLMRAMLRVDPSRRITAREASRHPFLASASGGAFSVVLPMRNDGVAGVVGSVFGGGAGSGVVDTRASSIETEEAPRRRRIREAAAARVSDSDEDEFDFSPGVGAVTHPADDDSATETPVEDPAAASRAPPSRGEDAVPARPTAEAVAAMDEIRRAYVRAGSSAASVQGAQKSLAPKTKSAPVAAATAGVAGVTLNGGGGPAAAPVVSRPKAEGAEGADTAVRRHHPGPLKKKSLLEDSDSDDEFHVGVVRPKARAPLTSRRAFGVGAATSGGGDVDGGYSSDEGDGARRIVPL